MGANISTRTSFCGSSSTFLSPRIKDFRGFIEFFDIMLAIKLHTDRRPHLGTGSHFMPFLNTAQGRAVLSAWARTLFRSGLVARNCFITLVQIPDRTNVIFSYDWFDTRLNGLHPALSAWKSVLEKEARSLKSFEKRSLLEINHMPEFPDEGTGFRFSMPEVILAEPLTRSNVKWTKRFRLWRQRS